MPCGGILCPDLDFAGFGDNAGDVFGTFDGIRDEFLELEACQHFAGNIIGRKYLQAIFSPIVTEHEKEKASSCRVLA
jgi:hypothetical protein